MENKKLELMTQDLSAGYDGKTIVSDVSITIPKNKISVILGANGCGKSTLLKTFAKLLKPEQGNILLDGKSIFSMPSKQMAQTLGLLPQSQEDDFHIENCLEVFKRTILQLLRKRLR